MTLSVAVAMLSPAVRTSVVLRLLLLGALALVACAIALGIPPERGLDLQGGVQLVFQVDAAERDRPLLEQTQEVIAGRLAAMGASDFSVIARGSRIYVELLGGDEARLAPIRAALTRSATLELVAVDDGWQPSDPPPGLELESDGLGPFLVARGPGARERLVAGLASMSPPAGRRFAIGAHEGDALRAYVLEHEGGLAGHVLDARAAHLGQPIVEVDFDEEGTRLLAELTRRQVDRRIAIVLDGEVVSAPRVSSPITAGRAQITLGAQEAQEALSEADSLAAALRSGALPAPIALEHETIFASTIPPSTQLLGVAASMVMWLVIAIAAAFRWRARGALWVLAGVSVALLGWVASTSLFGGVVTIASWLGFLLAAIAMLLAGMIHVELARRGRRGGWIVMGATHAALFIAATVIAALSAGFTRGFASGVLLTVPAALSACLLGASALAELRAPAAPVTRRS